MTSDRTPELVLAAAEACGVLQAYVAVAAISEYAAGRTFSAAELRAHARYRSWHLRVALEGAVGPDVTPRVVSAFLARWRDRSLAGLVVQMVGRDESGCIWRVCRQPVLTALAAVGDASAIDDTPEDA